MLSLYCAGFALAEVAQASHSTLKVSLLYDKRFARPVGARPADGGAGRAQPGEEWDGNAPPSDPLAVTGSGDLREFIVSSSFNTVEISATMSWSPGAAALAYDLDLFIDRQDATGRRVQVGSGTNGQLAGDGDATETAGVVFPPPGRYRTASHHLPEHGDGLPRHARVRQRQEGRQAFAGQGDGGPSRCRRRVTGARDLLRSVRRGGPDPRHQRGARELRAVDERISRVPDRPPPRVAASTRWSRARRGCRSSRPRGTSSGCSAAFDGGTDPEMKLEQPVDVAVDETGAIFVADLRDRAELIAKAANGVGLAAR